MRRIMAVAMLAVLVGGVSFFLASRMMPKQWELLAGRGLGWPDRKYYNVRSLAVDGDVLYVGVSAYPQAGGAAVYEYRAGQWTVIGGDGQAWEASNGSITDLEVFQGDLYAAVGYGDAQVWKRHAGRWELIGGKGVRNSWPEGSHEWAYCLEVHDGKLFVGLKNHSRSKQGRADVYVLDGDSWQHVGRWREHYGVYDLRSWQGHLYAGLHGFPDTGPAHTAQVWRYAGDQQWELVGGKGVRGSWNAPDASHCLCLTEHEGQLIATLGRPASNPIHPVWKFDGQQWAPVGLAPEAWKQMHIFNYAISHKGHLYIGAGGRPKNVATLWRLDGERYTQVAGEKRFGSWPAPVYPGAKATEWIYRMIVYQNDLLVGIAGGEAGQAQIWRQLPSLPGSTEPVQGTLVNSGM